MASAQALEIRPRTTGEILDDAWRLYLADAPRLLLLHGLFHVPAFSFLLLLVSTRPSFILWQFLLALAAAVLLPLTGLGSAAVQERLRRLADNHDATVLKCVGAALWRGLEHAAVRAVLLLACLLGPLALPLWPIGATLPTIIADNNGLVPGFMRIGQEARFDPGKTSGVVFCRLPMLVMAFVNAHLLVLVAVWVAGNLGGFDVALLDFELSLSNSVYDFALFLAVWLLLAPFFEASNYLLYLDTRTRQEGLDLLYRVQRAFSAVDPKRVAVILATLAGWLFLVPSLPMQAAPAADRVATIRIVRDEVEKIQQQVMDADPYTDGAAIERRLRGLGDKLNGAWAGQAEPFPWYKPLVDGFKDKTKRDALLTLAELQSRLTLLEETLSQRPEANTTQPPRSKDEVKKLLRQRDETPTANEPKKTKQDEKQNDIEPKRPVIRRDGPSGGGSPSSDGGLGVGAPAGMGNICLYVFAGLVLAVLVAGLVLFLVNRPWGKRTPTSQTGQSTPSRNRPSSNCINSRSPSCCAVPMLWRNKANIWKRCVPRFWRPCRYCIANSCSVMKRRAPTANMYGRSAWQRTRRRRWWNRSTS